jgi:DNA-binding IclR family transcriptional regulator
LRDRAHKYLEHLAKQTGETAHLAVLDKGEVLHLDKVESEHALRMTVAVGSSAPATTSALGKALLAYVPDDQLAAVISSRGLPAGRGNSITTVANLREELQSIRSRGYAVDNEEQSEGLRCFAAAVRGFSGDALASLSVAGPSIRLTDDRIPFVVKLVVQAAGALSEELGAGPGRTVLPKGREIIARFNG